MSRRGDAGEHDDGGATSASPAPKRRRARWWLLAVVAAAALIAVALIVRPSSGPEGVSPEQLAGAVSSAVEERLEEERSAPPDAAVVHEAILPSLVVIRAQHDDGGPYRGLGTGVIVNDQGAILTARHVVADALSLEVIFADGTQAQAQVVAEEPDNDIAVLIASPPPPVIVPAVLGGGVRVGDAVYAVGHPLGLASSLSAGVVSGLDRSLPVGGGRTLDGLIQFDAAVNPGSSGGPLLNRNAEVVGIVTGLANPVGQRQGYFIGIGFAVTIGAASGAAGGPQL